MRKVKKKRLRITPVVRFGISSALVLLCVGCGWWFGPRAISFVNRRAVDAGFCVKHVYIEGCKRVTSSSTRPIVQKFLNKPILGLALEDLHGQICALTWVKSATVSRRLPHSVYVYVSEFEPVAVWHHRKKWWIDRDGTVIGPSDGSLTHLPIISGEDAPQHVAVFLEEVERYPNVRKHAKAFARVRKRRWNIVMDHTTLVKLPQDGVGVALQQLEEWFASGKMHPRQVWVLDFRMGDKCVIQPQLGVTVHIK